MVKTPQSTLNLPNNTINSIRFTENQMSKIKEFVEKHIKVTFFVCAAVLSFIIYAQTIKYDFVHLDDDVLMIDRFQTLSDYKVIPSYFYKSVFSTKIDKYFRPVLMVSLAADAILGGLNPAAYHQMDILLHIFSVFLIFVFLLKLGFDKKICFAFCALFAVHPVFVQAVAWIPGRNDTLLAVFVMASLIFLIDYLNTKRSVYLFSHAFMFLAALLAKETAIVLIVIIPLMIFTFNKENYKISEIKKICFFLLFAAAVYFSLRHAALHNSRGNIPIVGSLKYILYALPSVFQYCDYLINPSSLSMFPVNINIDFFSFIFAFIIFGVPFILSFLFKQGRKTAVLFGFLWFALFLFPILILPPSIYIYMSHRLYLPVIGIMMMWIECGYLLLKNVSSLLKKSLFLLFAVIFVLFAIAAFYQTKKFQDRSIFWSNALNDAPESALVMANVGVYYYDNKIYDEAEKYFLKAVSLNSSDFKSYNNLGSVYMLRGDTETALLCFKHSLLINPDYDIALYNLSRFHYHVLGDIEEAYNLALKAVALEHENAGYKEYYEKIKKAKSLLQ